MLNEKLLIDLLKYKLKAANGMIETLPEELKVSIKKRKRDILTAISDIVGEELQGTVHEQRNTSLKKISIE